MENKNLIIDTSSVLWMSLYAGRDEENGKEVEFKGRKTLINSADFGFENAINHMQGAIKRLGIEPCNMILVREGDNSKLLRKVLFPGYKEGSEKAPEAYEQFNILRERFIKHYLDLGAMSCTQSGLEADDVIAYLSRKLIGDSYILSNDGDLAALIGGNAHLLRRDELDVNPYGPFSVKYITLYKALVGDTSDKIPGAKGFGPKAFLDLLCLFGEDGLEMMQGLVLNKEISKLAEDVGELKTLQKVIDAEEMVYTSWACARFYDDKVDTIRMPLKWSKAIEVPRLWFDEMYPVKPDAIKQHVVFDCEIIGKDKPVFLVCAEVVETGKKASFWWHKEGDMKRLHDALKREDYTWVSFNGIHFDAPICSAAIDGKDPRILKDIAKEIIVKEGLSWEMPDQFNFKPIKFDHIDLIDVAPGVRTSLKTYAGRMSYPTMVDLPFEHDQDLTEEECVVLETYCLNDIGATKALFLKLKSEVDLRREMSIQYGIDLRSKSDAQMAEAILKKAAKITGTKDSIPTFVKYKVPEFIQTESSEIGVVISQLKQTDFMINPANCQLVSPAFLENPIQMGYGTYQMGVGGLHSTHDVKLYVEATEETLISDFDVASYYPNIMLKAGLTPNLHGANGAGQRFIDEYRKIYDRRLEAKRAGDKKVADALKISLNGTFGKLGSPYSVFYSPDLLLAVTMTGQLNLMCLIYDLECKPTIKVLSANTDGIMVQYPASQRTLVLEAVARNAKRTGFEYEETEYSCVAMKDVNNYVAITTMGKAKRKGLYSEMGLMKNPTMEACSNMLVDYLKDGIWPEESIKNYTEMSDFVAIRSVKGGGIQYDKFVMVDDWVEVADRIEADDWVEVIPGEWRRPHWAEIEPSIKKKKRPKPVKVTERQWKRQAWLDGADDRAAVERKSRPNPVEVGIGGTPFGRIARWYMSVNSSTPINYIGSGNKVPKTHGARLCMTLPEALPDDLDRQWYIDEAYSMLEDVGVVLARAGGTRHESEEEDAVVAIKPPSENDLWDAPKARAA